MGSSPLLTGKMECDFLHAPAEHFWDLLKLGGVAGRELRVPLRVNLKNQEPTKTDVESP